MYQGIVVLHCVNVCLCLFGPVMADDFFSFNTRTEIPLRLINFVSIHPLILLLEILNTSKFSKPVLMITLCKVITLLVRNGDCFILGPV